MTEQLSHETAPTQYVEADGIRYAFRRFGKNKGLPLVFFQHFTGTMDNWDPAVTNGFAKDRTVVIFDNTGIGRSGGETPNNLPAMTKDALRFIDALGLTQVDLLGFSIGGMIAQQILFDRPKLARRVVLVATGPQGGEGMTPFTDEAMSIIADKTESGSKLPRLFFSPTEASQAAARRFLQRLSARKADRDPPSTAQVASAQLTAIAAWGAPIDKDYAPLRVIGQPILVVNGNNDIMIPTVNSYILSQNLPNAQLIIYPDSGHGSLFQYPELFVAHAHRFLNG